MAVRDVHILSKYKAKKSFVAGRGEDGGNKSLHGKNGANFVLELPVGSIITRTDTDERWQLTKEGEKIMLLKGGYGGFGNEHFKSSINTTPQEHKEESRWRKSKFQNRIGTFCRYWFDWTSKCGKEFTFKFFNECSSASRGLCFYYS